MEKGNGNSGLAILTMFAEGQRRSGKGLPGPIEHCRPIDGGMLVSWIELTVKYEVESFPVNDDDRDLPEHQMW